MSAYIRFLCPTCKSVMEAPVQSAGHKVHCLKCGQRLQIPPAERARTILAPGLGVREEGEELPAYSSVPTAQFAPPVTADASAPASAVDRSTGTARRGRLRRLWGDRRTRLIVTGMAAGLALGCFLWLGVG